MFSRWKGMFGKDCAIYFFDRFEQRDSRSESAEAMQETGKGLFAMDGVQNFFLASERMDAIRSSEQGTSEEKVPCSFFFSYGEGLCALKNL